MPARSHTRPHPATTGGADIRIPWWALALPILAFLVLLGMVLNPSDTQAAATHPTVTQLLERLQQLMTS
ncbi:hypothetical protein [Streptomyces acidiscabies]|uniref:Uncharacterized protein n=1 Tax=Streptomyces acidiscabies TaxID=42234 RepID=A0A0L0JEP9_9ACTN|nr:hypothetical protein [Streptomyces acidiscabies]KND24141.1 hypothetical protein IQ63_43475 [Streptomyces acidiscabies]MBZ3911743.1 hypothetical protein [Streptomyces acidiscabies]MDX2958969.1 hypothetical protein [Streptomyces acidiscabies]MDX3018406.1 hypothetical protein [Streptomyces acidiscabies]MDX3794641.1 hypothetical protein [Streptomyces acidiscabies]